MTPTEFVYWLRGYVEISGATTLNETQLKIVQDHLDLVLTKVTPERDPRDNRKCEKVTGPINHAWPQKLCSQQLPEFVRPQQVMGLETYC